MRMRRQGRSSHSLDYSLSVFSLGASFNGSLPGPFDHKAGTQKHYTGLFSLRCTAAYSTSILSTQGSSKCTRPPLPPEQHLMARLRLLLFSEEHEHPVGFGAAHTKSLAERTYQKSS